MFGLEDVPWVSRSIDGAIRVTIEDSTHSKLLEQKNNIEKDSIFGRGTVKVHLFFQWLPTSGDSGRLVGHFDVLFPRRCPVSLMLPPDDPWLLCGDGDSRIPMNPSLFVRMVQPPEIRVPRSSLDDAFMSHASDQRYNEDDDLRPVQDRLFWTVLFADKLGAKLRMPPYGRTKSHQRRLLQQRPFTAWCSMKQFIISCHLIMYIYIYLFFQ